MKWVISGPWNELNGCWLDEACKRKFVSLWDEVYLHRNFDQWFLEGTALNTDNDSFEFCTFCRKYVEDEMVIQANTAFLRCTLIQNFCC
jgi:hypothetical protein